MARSLLSCILLLELALCTAETKYTLSLQQPPAVTVSMGESVTLNCSFQGQEIDKFSSLWYFFPNNMHEARRTWSYDNQTLLTAHPKAKNFVQHGEYMSYMEMADLQISDAGTYICTVEITTPPPTRIWTGTGTVLSILAPPRVWLSLFYADDPTLVTCMVSEFYPTSINVTLISTCGGCRELKDSRPKTQNLDGTYNTTRTALLTMEGCVNGIEVICNVTHETGQWRESLRIPAQKIKGEELRLSSNLLIKVIGIAAFAVIVCVIFLGYHVYSEKTKVQVEKLAE